MWRETSVSEHVISKVMLPTAVWCLRYCSQYPCSSCRRGMKWEERKINMEKHYWFLFCSTEFNLSLILLEFKIFGSCSLLIHPEPDESSYLLSLEDLQKQKELMLEKALLMLPVPQKGNPLIHRSMREVRAFWNVMKPASKVSFSAERNVLQSRAGAQSTGKRTVGVAPCRDTWAVGQLSQHKTCSLGFVLCSAGSVVTVWPPRGAEAAAQRGFTMG